MISLLPLVLAKSEMTARTQVFSSFNLPFVIVSDLDCTDWYREVVKSKILNTSQS